MPKKPSSILSSVSIEHRLVIVTDRRRQTNTDTESFLVPALAWHRVGKTVFSKETAAAKVRGVSPRQGRESC